MDFQAILLKCAVYSIPAVSMVYVIVGLKLFKQTGRFRANAFSLLMFAVAVYSFGYFLELNTTEMSLLRSVRDFEFFGAVFVPSLGILFIRELLKKKSSRLLKTILIGISVLLWILFITDPLHSLIYKRIDLEVIEGFGIVLTQRAPLFYSMLVFDAAFVLYASIALFQAWRGEKDPRKKRGDLFLLLTFQIPWITLWIIFLRIDKYFDPVPETIMVIGFLLLISDIRSDLFDLQITRWKGAFAGIGEPALLVGKDHRVLCVNSRAVESFESLDETVKLLRDALCRGSMDSRTLAFQIRGETRWFDCRRTDFNVKRNLVSYLLIDVTQKITEQEKLRVSEEKYRLLTEFASDVIWVMNVATEKFSYVSPSIFHLRGITAQEAMNEKLEDSLTAESLKLCRDALQKNVREFLSNPDWPNYYINEIQQRHRDGSLIWVEISARFRYAAKGEIEVVGVSRNIEERKRAEKELLYQNYHDRLTGLYNRKYYEENIPLLERAENLPLALIVADINGLKLINDAFGNKLGDVLLAKVAGILEKQGKDDGIAARIGGDEFLLALPRCDKKSAGKTIGRIHSAIAKIKSDNAILSLSIGYAIKQEISESIDEVYKKAEDEMYKSMFYENTNARSKTVDLIMTTLYEKNPREMLHSQRVSSICGAVAARMGLEPAEVHQVRLAGLMHDIGKIGIDEGILNKSGALLPEERLLIEKHAEMGWRILSSVNEFSEIATYVLAHHERWDGRGYPQSLSGEKIPLGARIIALADSYDAMTGERTYRHAFGKESAIHEIVRCSGKQFDPVVANLFIEMIEKDEL